MSNDENMDDMENFSEDEMLESDLGDEEFAEGEWDEYEDEFGDFEESAPAGKKFPLSFNMIVIIGAVVVGLGVLYMTMGGGGTDTQSQNALPPQPAPAQTAAVQPEQSPSMPVETDQQPPSMGGMFDDVASLEGVENMQPGDEGDQSLQPLPEDQDGIEDMEGGPLMPMPVKEPSDALSAGLPKARDVMIGDAGKMPESNQVASRPKPASSDLEALMERFDALEGQIESLQDNMADKDDLSALSKKVSSLEKRLNNVRAQSTATAAPRPSPVAPKAAPRAAEVDQWILKSARPGAATLGKKGSEEVIAVAEGDSLQSIGKIISIKPEAGLWVVQGTKGRITQ